MKKKKNQKKKNKLPVLQDDDFSFGGEVQEKESFVEAFDPDLFDKESSLLLPESLAEKIHLITCSPFPQDQLDLHGNTVAQSELKVDSFLLTCRVKGARSAKIITGKGLHSEGGAVLPDFVESLLKKMQHEGQIANYRWEQGEKEKSGAVIVCL